MSAIAAEIAGRELIRVSEALADAIERDALDEAERLLAARQTLLDGLAQSPHAAAPALRAGAATIAAAHHRSHTVLLARVGRLRDELGTLATGVTAMRAYAPVEPLAPGFLDRRD